MSVVGSYKPHDYLKCKKDFILSLEGPSRVLFNRQKCVIVIDLTPSMYTYHRVTKDMIYNNVVPTIKTLIKSIYRLGIDIEVSVICTRMFHAPLHVLVHSYQVKSEANYKDLMSYIKYELNNIHSNFKVNKDESRNIKFNTVLKWSLFALEMMEKDRLPLAILITNTVDSFVSSAIYDGLVMQYSANEVSFNVISVCREKGLTLGLNSDYLALKDAAKATGGKFFWADKLENIDEMFTRQVYCQRIFSQKHLIKEYSLCIEFEQLVLCRLREGFVLWNTGEWIVLGLYCGNNVSIEYQLKPGEKHINYIRIFLISSDSIASKVKERLNTKTVNIRNEEPSFSERISWILINLTETENFAVYISKVISGEESQQKLLSTNLNIWHRWMNVDRIDIIVSKSNNEFSLTQGKKKLLESIQEIYTQFENDCLIDTNGRYLLIGKIVWEGMNKATLFLGCYGKDLAQKVQDTYDHLKKTAGIDVYNKPFGKMLVECISTSKNYNSFVVQSVQTYKPHIEALKAYLLRRFYKYRLLNKSWHPVLISLFHESAVKKGFFLIGNCLNNKQLLLKSQKLNNTNQVIFLQYLIYKNQNEVHAEFYIDPHVINKEEAWKDCQVILEKSEDFVYKSLQALDFAVYKCLRKKLNDDDFSSEEIQEKKEFKLSTSDDIYCYIDANSALDYRSHKKAIRKKMLKALEKYDSAPTEVPLISILIKHSTYHSYKFTNFIPENSSSVQVKENSKVFIKNLRSAFMEISDYYRTENNLDYFVRYLSEESVCIWILPCFSQKIIHDSRTVVMNIYDCALNKIDANNVSASKDRGLSVSQVLLKTISLIQRTYNSAYNLTFCQLFDRVQTNPSCLMTVIKNCDSDKKTVDCSGLFKMIHKVWTDVDSLVSSLCQTSLLLLSDSFSCMDSEFILDLDRYFTKIGKSNLYIYKNKEAGVFLKFGNYSDKLSHSLKASSITFEVFTFPKSHFFRKEITALKKIEKFSNSEVLDLICKRASALLSQQALELLINKESITKGTIEQVQRHLKLISDTVEHSISLNLTTKNIDFSEIIHFELMKNQVFYCRNIENVYYLVSSETDRNFFLEKDYQKCHCDWNYKEDTSFWIDFWILLTIEANNSVKFSFFLPKNLEYPLLNKEIIRTRMIKQIKKLEVRVNQRILIKNLRETGKISSMLIPDKYFNEDQNPEKPKTNSTGLFGKKQGASQDKSNYQGLYKLPLHFVKSFSIADRLKKSALNFLKSKYMTPPFSIDNTEDLFTLVDKQDVSFFKFCEISANAGSGAQKSEKKDSNCLIKLLVYGIDPPKSDTVTKLYKNIEDTLEQISMTELAESLTKNQKKVMPENDYKFIIGNQFPDTILYRLSDKITQFELLTEMISQNLSRFLTSFKVSSKDVLIYNCLDILETTVSKSHLTLRSKNTGSDNFIGNTFGRALALISFEMVYFNGEEISDCKSIKKLNEDFDSSDEIREYYEELEKFSSIPIPYIPGFYLLMRISQKGALNREKFKKYLDNCIRQSIFEYILEKIREKCEKLSFQQRFNFSTECSRAALNASTKDRKMKIKHFCHWQNIFLIYSQVLEMLLEQLDHKVEFCYGFLTQNVNFCSKNLNDIKEQWMLISGEEHIGTSVIFSAVIDQDQLKDSQIQNLKFYQSETKNNVKISRSIFIYLDVTNENLNISTYNISKSAFFKIQQAVENHISWTKERYLYLNSILICKLGLFNHNLSIQASGPSKTENLNSILPKACCLVEIKDTKKNFRPEVFINPHDMTHIESNGDESSHDVKLKGSYPLIRYGIELPADEDHTRRHGFHINSFLDKKSDHLAECGNIALAYIKWIKEKNHNFEKMIFKLSKKVKVRDEFTLMGNILGSAQMFLKVSSRVYIQGTEKNTKTSCALIKMYNEKLSKVCKYGLPIQNEAKNSRKFSYENPENPFQYIRNYFSSGALVSDGRLDSLHCYMKNSFSESLIVIEVSFEDSLISTSGYVIENFYKCIPYYKAETQSNNFSYLTKEISRLRLNIDPISILYDIHLRCISNTLENQNTVTDFDIISTMNLICAEFKKPPRKSSNILFSFPIFVDLGDTTNWTAEEFYTFVMLNCKQKDFTLAHYHKKSKFIYKKIQVIQDESKNKEKPSIKWCIFTQAPSKITDFVQLSIKCHVVKCDEAKKMKNEPVKSIKNSIEKEFQSMMVEFKEFYRRDQLWEKIRGPETSFSLEDLQLLLKASVVASMYDVDYRVKLLASCKNVFTMSCIRYLSEAYSKNSKTFELGDEVYLVIIFSQRILAQLVLDKEQQSLQMFSVKRSVGCIEKDENDLITELINKIIQWLWVRLTTNESL